MKKIILAILLAVLPVLASASSTNFVRLSANKAAYSAGDKAVLMAYLQILPTGNDEVFMSAKFTGSAVRLTNFSTREWVTLSPQLITVGPEDWEVSVYLQDKTIAAELQGTLAFYSNEILQSQKNLDGESDADKRAILQQIIARDQVIVSDTNAQLTQLRRLVEVQHLTIVVNPAREAREDFLATDPLALTLDRSPANYPVGSRATLLTHVNLTVTGPDGATENILQVSLDTTPLGSAIASAKDFSTTSATFAAANLGAHTFHVTLLTRSKSEADSLRSALAAAITKKASWQSQFDAASDPLQRAYIQHQIDDLNAIIAGLNAQLVTILANQVTKDIAITVTN